MNADIIGIYHIIIAINTNNAFLLVNWYGATIQWYLDWKFSFPQLHTQLPNFSFNMPYHNLIPTSDSSF